MEISASRPGSQLAAPAQTQAALRRVAQQFEAQALGALLQPMFQGLQTGGLFGGGAAEGQWRPMLVDAIARDLSRTGAKDRSRIGGLGIGEAVLRELTRIAGAQPGTTPTPVSDMETTRP